MNKFLHLQPNFYPYNNLPIEDWDTINIQYDKFIFNGGEPHIKIKTSVYNEDTVYIATRINNMDDLGMLLVAVNALRNIANNCCIKLFLPYFPGARQDRVMVTGEPLTVKIYADIINNLYLDQVTILDPHSDVTPALLDNCNVINNHTFVNLALNKLNFPKQVNDNSPYLIVADAGAGKKCTSLALNINRFNKLVKCDKTRDITNGNLTGFEVYEDDLKGRDCIIVDDICDGGGTFIGLAKELKTKNAGDLYLIVTHGIFSKGFSGLNDYFTKMITTDSIKSKISKKLQIINLNSFITYE